MTTATDARTASVWHWSRADGGCLYECRPKFKIPGPMMAADMDPNDHDTMHYGEPVLWLGYRPACGVMPASGRKITEEWGKVTCRMCVFYSRAQNGVTG